MKERAIEVSNLKKYFKDVKAVDDISFSVEQGELFGFLGVNGAGKSTVINILCTLYKKDGGSVRVLGNEVGKDDEKIRQDIGMVHQENSLDELLKVIVGIALNVVLFSIGAYGISLGLRSSKGWSTLASISGTLVGFLGGVYLPMGFLPKGVASVLKFLPFLHGASILRKSCVQAALDKTFAGCPSEIATNYQEYIGITVKAGGHVLSTAAQVGIMTLWLVAALAAVFAISRRKHLNR